MKEKILFSILVLTIVPIATYAINTPEQMAKGIQDLTWLIGTAIVVISWTIAGIMYLVSMGSPEKMTTARKALIAATIGTVLVVIAGVGYAGIKTFLNPIIGQ